MDCWSAVSGVCQRQGPGIVGLLFQESAKDRAHVHMEGSTPWLELLLGISGAFRPKILTCLMGVTGAGKTTLMDVLAGRKTGGPHVPVSDSNRTVFVTMLPSCQTYQE